MKRSTVLITVIVATIAVWLVMLIYVTNRAQQQRDRLCLVMYALINRNGEQIGKEGSPGYSYYRVHPKEREQARRQNKRFLAALPCNPEPPPPPLRTTED